MSATMGSVYHKSDLHRNGKPLPFHDVHKSSLAGGAMGAIPMWPSRSAGIDLRDRWQSAVLRTPFAAVISPFRMLVVFVRDIGDVAGHSVHELGDRTGNVLVQVRLQLALEVEALVLSGLVLFVVVHPLQLSRGRLIELWRGA